MTLRRFGLIVWRMVCTSIWEPFIGCMNEWKSMAMARSKEVCKQFALMNLPNFPRWHTLVEVREIKSHKWIYIYMYASMCLQIWDPLDKSANNELSIYASPYMKDIIVRQDYLICMILQIRDSFLRICLHVICFKGKTIKNELSVIAKQRGWDGSPNLFTWLRWVDFLC